MRALSVFNYQTELKNMREMEKKKSHTYGTIECELIRGSK